MAHLSSEGTSKKNARKMDSHALLRIGHALRGLVNSLEEFREVETILGLDTAAGDDPGSCNEFSPNSLHLGAGTLKEMVESLVSDIEAKPEIQKLLLAIQKPSSNANNDFVLLQDATTTNPPPTPSLCISGINLSAVTRDSLERAVICRHSCAHHLELMDPLLWSTFPEEMVEIVFASLSIDRIFKLCAQSMAWSTISKYPKFRRVFCEKHPKLFGLVGWDEEENAVCNVMYDMKSKEWVNHKLGGFPRCLDTTTDVHDSDYSSNYLVSDGGLVCFVFVVNLLFYPIVVGNPLTDEWKALPCIPATLIEPERMSMDGEPYDSVFCTAVQLVVEEDTKYYRVMLITADRSLQRGAYCYDSKSGAWSKMTSGLVYGHSGRTIYDCTEKKFSDLRSQFPRDYSHICDCKERAMVKDHLFELQTWPRTRRWGEQEDTRLRVSEYSRQGSVSVVDVDVMSFPTYSSTEYALKFLACGGFFLLFANNHQRKQGTERHQHLGLYDRVANAWQSLPIDDVVTCHGLYWLFSQTSLCELQWDVGP